MDFSDLPEPSQLRIAAAEIQADSDFENYHAKARWLENEASHLGLDPSGIGFSAGSPLLEQSRKMMREGSESVAGSLFAMATGEYLKHSHLSAQEFHTKLDSIGDWVVRKYQVDRSVIERLTQIAALLRRAAAMEATDPPWRKPGMANPKRGMANPEAKTRRREFIKGYRAKHGLTMEAFARQAGMSSTAIQGMVQGDRRRYSAEKLSKLLTLIGVSPEQW